MNCIEVLVSADTIRADFRHQGKKSVVRDELTRIAHFDGEATLESEEIVAGAGATIYTGTYSSPIHLLLETRSICLHRTRSWGRDGKICDS